MLLLKISHLLHSLLHNAKSYKIIPYRNAVQYHIKHKGGEKESQVIHFYKLNYKCKLW